MSVTRVTSNKNNNSGIGLDRIRNEKNKINAIEELLELVRDNPDITEDMVKPELRQYLGIVKREYKAELIKNISKKGR